MDIEQIQRLCREVERKSGKGSIFMIGKESNMQIPRWSTSIEALDNLIDFSSVNVL